MTIYNAKKLDGQLKAAGIPIDGVSSSGRIDYKPEATTEQRATGTEILAAHDSVDYSITASNRYIRGDGVDSSVVTVTASGNIVNVLVNSVSQPVVLTDGVGTLTIVSPSPNTTITITGASGELATKRDVIYVL